VGFSGHTKKKKPGRTGIKGGRGRVQEKRTVTKKGKKQNGKVQAKEGYKDYQLERTSLHNGREGERPKEKAPAAAPRGQKNAIGRSCNTGKGKKKKKEAVRLFQIFKNMTSRDHGWFGSRLPGGGYDAKRGEIYIKRGLS